MLHPLRVRATGKSRGGAIYINAQLGQMTTAGFSLHFAGLETLGSEGRTLPPVADWHPPHCGDSFMRIARDGTWFHQGTPIGRRELVRLFSSILRKDDDGFMLVTPAEKVSIAVEDAPFIAVLMHVAGTGREQRLTFITNVGDETSADADHPLRFVYHKGAPVPYVHVRGGLEAKLARPVYYQLIDLAVAETDRLGIWSGGTFFALDGA